LARVAAHAAGGAKNTAPAEPRHIRCSTPARRQEAAWDDEKERITMYGYSDEQLQAQMERHGTTDWAYSAIPAPDGHTYAVDNTQGYVRSFRTLADAVHFAREFGQRVLVIDGVPTPATADLLYQPRRG
jgi:hypothetical protein